MTADTKPHSKCMTCDIDLATEADAAQHRSQTFGTQDSEFGPMTASHQTRTLNVTPAARSLRAARLTVEDALEEACSFLERALERGEFSDDDLDDALRTADLALAWQEYTR